MSARLVFTISERTGVAAHDVDKVLDALQEVAFSDLNTRGRFDFKSFLKMTMVKKPARAARVVTLYAHRVVAKAHAAKNIIKCKMLAKFVKRAQPEIMSSDDMDS